MLSWLVELLRWPSRLPFGGGSDGGATDRAAAEERQKQDAIARVNQYFGVPMTQKLTTVMDPIVRTTGSNDPRGGSPLTTTTSYRPREVVVPVTGGDPIADANKQAREALYAKTRSDVIDQNTAELENDQAKAQRAVKFFLARTGNTGGSLDIDKNAELMRDRDEGLRKVSLAGESAANEFQSADEQARLATIDRILSGADASTAIQSTSNALAENARNIAGKNYGGAAAGAFSSLASIYGAGQDAAGVEDAASRYKRVLAGVTAQPKGTGGTLGRTR